MIINRKKHMRFIFFALLLLVTSCSLKKDYPEIAHDITLRTADELYREKGMMLVGTGGGMIKQVNLLSMRLHYYVPLEEAEARQLALFTLDKFLNNVNADEKVRPYLNNYPFRAEHLRVSLSFYHRDGRPVEPGKIDYISIRRGYLHYNTRSKEADRRVTLFKETIAEARKKAESP